MMSADKTNLGEFSPITELARRLFHLVKWLSPMPWLGRKYPLFRPRSELTLNEVSSRDFTKRRARAIELYLILWLLVVIALVGISLLGPVSRFVSLLLTIVVSLRIVEIVQVTVNATLFDALSGRPDERVASRVRMLVLAGVNFMELWLCFGVIYATHYLRLRGAGRPVTAFYLSIITQLTIGYGDVYPTGWLRLVAAIQGITGLLFVILVFGRFITSLPRVSGIFDDDRSSGSA
jgi:hypothetical protein